MLGLRDGGGLRRRAHDGMSCSFCCGGGNKAGKGTRFELIIGCAFYLKQSLPCIMHLVEQVSIYSLLFLPCFFWFDNLHVVQHDNIF